MVHRHKKGEHKSVKSIFIPFLRKEAIEEFSERKPERIHGGKRIPLSQKFLCLIWNIYVCCLIEKLSDGVVIVVQKVFFEVNGLSFNLYHLVNVRFCKLPFPSSEEPHLMVGIPSSVLHPLPKNDILPWNPIAVNF